jgi:hypothetical protein
MALDLKDLEDSDHLLDALIQCEDILDSLDVYVYRNWFSGEVIEGPIIKRHWVSITLLYPTRKMPDPKAALRLMKHGISLEFTKVKKENDKHETKGMAASEEHEDHEKNKYWMVEITFPRRLLKPITNDLERYDDEVEVSDVEDAKDGGMEADTAYQDEAGQGDFVDPAQADMQQQNVPPPAPPQGGGF